ncbi:DUF2929 domain-containing protein [Bacillus sp. 7504-2]|nr:DUF2929 domain-containing protein [Bacillus sp. 7504-2]
MKYFWTFFWTFALVQMLTYVASSMIGVQYEFVTGAILGVAATIVILMIPAIIPDEPSGKEGIH